jgi:hypothetical protein
MAGAPVGQNRLIIAIDYGTTFTGRDIDIDIELYLTRA